MLLSSFSLFSSCSRIYNKQILKVALTAIVWSVEIEFAFGYVIPN